MTTKHKGDFLRLLAAGKANKPFTLQTVQQLKSLVVLEDIDEYIYTEITSLRKTYELPEEWKKNRIRLQKEETLVHLPSHILQHLCQKALPFIQSMPSSHSKGHLLRDIVNLFVLLHDREVASWNDIELLLAFLLAFSTT